MSGGFAALLSFRVIRTPFKYLSLVLGTISLVFLSSAIFLGDTNPLDFLGLDGIERWVVYPVLLWVTGLGRYLMGDADKEE